MEGNKMDSILTSLPGLERRMGEWRAFIVKHCNREEATADANQEDQQTRIRGRENEDMKTGQPLSQDEEGQAQGERTRARGRKKQS